jgi:hypothetical protein
VSVRLVFSDSVVLSVSSSIPALNMASDNAGVVNMFLSCSIIRVRVYFYILSVLRSIKLGVFSMLILCLLRNEKYSSQISKAIFYSVEKNLRNCSLPPSGIRREF